MTDQTLLCATTSAAAVTVQDPTAAHAVPAPSWPRTWAGVTAAPLHAWLTRSGLMSCSVSHPGSRRVRLTTAGVPTDPVLDRYATLVDRHPDASLVVYLRGLAERYFPDLPLASALGYLFVAEQHNLVDPFHRGKPLLVAHKWRQVGREKDGWLIEAAGLHAGEVATGAPTRTGLLMMAALRGAVLPHA